MTNNNVKTPWKITALVTLISVVGVFFWSLLAEAHEFTVNNNNVVLSGDIDAGATKELEKVLDNNPSVDTVIMSSRGGSFVEGVLLGTMFHERKLTTAVVSGQYCVSSCAFAFLGGHKQHLGGTIAFHRAWTDDRKIGANELFGDGQQVGGYMVWYIINVGYNSQLAYFIQAKTTKNTYLVITDKVDLDALFVSSDTNTPVSRYLNPTGVSAEWLRVRIKSGGSF